MVFVPAWFLNIKVPFDELAIPSVVADCRLIFPLPACKVVVLVELVDPIVIVDIPEALALLPIAMVSVMALLVAPIWIVLLLAPVPRLTVPVVPESRLRVVVPVTLRAAPAADCSVE